MRISDWSSDVCSSDLRPLRDHPGRAELEVILSLIRSCRMPRGHPGERFIPGIAHVPVCPVPSRISPTVHAECRAQRGVSRHARISGDRHLRFDEDRKSHVYGKSVSVSVDLGGPRIITTNKQHYPTLIHTTYIMVPQEHLTTKHLTT